MTAPQNFRASFNGFNREDVVHYLEYINTKHKNQIDQLMAENQELRDAAPKPEEMQTVAFLQQLCADLTVQLEEEKARCAELTSQLEALQAQYDECVQSEATEPEPIVVAEEPTPAPAAPSLVSEELEAYRRAERIEREARERAELVYFQANSVLTEAAGKVDTIANDVTDMADQVMRQLTQLQMAVSSSKQALQDASSIMNTIRPNK